MSVSEERSSWNRRCILDFWRLNLFRLRWQFYSTFSTLVGNCPENGLNACLFFYWFPIDMTRSWFLISTVCFGSCAHNIYGSEPCECLYIGAVRRLYFIRRACWAKSVMCLLLLFLFWHVVSDSAGLFRQTQAKRFVSVILCKRF